MKGTLGNETTEARDSVDKTAQPVVAHPGPDRSASYGGAPLSGPEATKIRA